MRRMSIACIVEGDGEVAAVPILVRRVVAEIDPTLRVHIPPPPMRVSRLKEETTALHWDFDVPLAKYKRLGAGT